MLKPGDDTKLFAATFGRGVQMYDFATAGGAAVTPTTGTANDSQRFGGAFPAMTLVILFMLGMVRRSRGT